MSKISKFQTKGTQIYYGGKNRYRVYDKNMELTKPYKKRVRQGVVGIVPGWLYNDRTNRFYKDTVATRNKFSDHLIRNGTIFDENEVRNLLNYMIQGENKQALKNWTGLYNFHVPTDYNEDESIDYMKPILLNQIQQIFETNGAVKVWVAPQAIFKNPATNEVDERTLNQATANGRNKSFNLLDVSYIGDVVERTIQHFKESVPKVAQQNSGWVF